MSKALTSKPAAKSSKAGKPASQTTIARLFFLDLSEGRVMSCNPDGSDLRTIVSQAGHMPDGIVVDDVQVHRIGIAEMGDGTEALETGLPQLLLGLQIEGDDGTPRSAWKEIGVNQHVAVQRKHRAIVSLPCDKFFAVIDKANRDLAILVLLADQFHLIVLREAQKRVCNAGTLRRPTPSRGVGDLLVVLAVGKTRASQRKSQCTKQNESIHDSFLMK